jgi:hypothetical protein
MSLLKMVDMIKLNKNNNDKRDVGESPWQWIVDYITKLVNSHGPWYDLDSDKFGGTCSLRLQRPHTPPTPHAADTGWLTIGVCSVDADAEGHVLARQGLQRLCLRHLPRSLEDQPRRTSSFSSEHRVLIVLCAILRVRSYVRVRVWCLR